MSVVGREPLRVVHVITDTTVGGAQMVLWRLLAGTDRARVEPSVIALGMPGPLARRIEDLGIEVECLGLRGLGDLPRGLAVLRRRLRAQRPAVVQTWMYHAHFLGGLAARLAGTGPVAWNVRSARLAPGAHARATRLLARVNAALSHVLPAAVVCLGEAARDWHGRIGYRRRRLVVIDNGWVATEPDPRARQRLREELEVGADEVLIARVCRFDPQKDLPGFLRAVGRVLRRHDAHVVMCGTGITWDNAALATWIHRTGVASRIHLLGERQDVASVYAAADVVCSSSIAGEAVPNTIGEAMAHGVPVVTTDDGDCARMVDDTGLVVPPGDDRRLADALAQVIAMAPDARLRLGRRAQDRIREHFALGAMIERYTRLHARLADEARGPRRR